MSLIDDLLDMHERAFAKLCEAFGYVEDWRALPFDDRRGFWWWLSGEGSGDRVVFGEPGDVAAQLALGDYYYNEIYTQRFLPRWVYRAETHTMVCVDTNVDGNKLLAIFDNAKLITDPSLVAILEVEILKDP